MQPIMFFHQLSKWVLEIHTFNMFQIWILSNNNARINDNILSYMTNGNNPFDCSRQIERLNGSFTFVLYVKDTIVWVEWTNSLLYTSSHTNKKSEDTAWSSKKNSKYRPCPTINKMSTGAAHFRKFLCSKTLIHGQRRMERIDTGF